MTPVSRYEEVAQQALSWVLNHKSEFALPSVENPSLVTLFKPLGELALTAEILISHSPASWFHQLGMDLLSHCWDQMREGELLHHMVAEHPDLILVAALYPPFYRYGMRNRKFEQVLRDVANIRGIAALEFPAWRMLELAIAFRALGIESPWNVEASFRRTWLYAMPEPWAISVSAAYSLTHTVFYKTGFGAEPGQIPEEQRRYLGLWLPVWVEHYQTIRNYDLLSEMIMVARCIGEPDAGDWSAMLLAFQESDGMLPSPSPRGGSLDPQATAPSRRRFLDNYHTTLVGLMASVMSHEGTRRDRRLR